MGYVGIFRRIPGCSPTILCHPKSSKKFQKIPHLPPPAAGFGSIFSLLLPPEMKIPFSRVKLGMREAARPHPRSVPSWAPPAPSASRWEFRDQGWAGKKKKPPRSVARCPAAQKSPGKKKPKKKNRENWICLDQNSTIQPKFSSWEKCPQGRNPDFISRNPEILKGFAAPHLRGVPVPKNSQGILRLWIFPGLGLEF